MTARARKVMEEMAELSPAELAEVLRRFGRVAHDDDRRVCRNSDLIRFLDGHAPDPEFADDIEAGVRGRRARAEHRASPWDR